MCIRDSGASHIFTQAEAAGFRENVSENRTALFVSHVKQFGKLTLQSSLRQEWFNGEAVPFIPSVGASYDFTKAIKAKAKISRNYRIPTLNDRFWNPGGNPDLQAESGWSQEATLEYKRELDKNPFSFSLTGYSRRINAVSYTHLTLPTICSV